MGLQTRYGYLSLGTGGISVSLNVVLIPANIYVSRLFEQLFVAGRPDEKKRQIERLREGQSVLNTVQEAVRRLKQRVSRTDQRKVDEYITSVREAERQLAKAEQWQHKPKPEVDADPPPQIQQSQQIYDIMFLALQTDSTRLITYSVGGSSYVPVMPGVSMNYHHLSHHGQNPEKLKQLAIVESQQVTLFGDFLRRLKETIRRRIQSSEQDNAAFGFAHAQRKPRQSKSADHRCRRWFPSRTASCVRS